MSWISDKRLLLLGLIFAVGGGAVWWQFRAEPGVETMGDADTTMAMIGMVASLAGLATSIVSLVITVLQSRSGK